MKAVILSDLHVGGFGSTITDEDTLTRLANELRALGDIDEIILLGDVMELSTGITKTAALRGFRHVAGTLAPLCERLVYVPGNHDHHIWVMQVEREMMKLMEQGSVDALGEGGYGSGEFVGDDAILSSYMPPEQRHKLVIKYPFHTITMGGHKILLYHGHQMYGIGAKLLSPEEAEKDFPYPLPSFVRQNELELQNAPVYELWYWLGVSESLRDRMRRAWQTKGGYGAFALMAKELADNKVADIILDFGKLFAGPPERGRSIEDNITELAKFASLFAHGCDGIIYGHSHVPELASAADMAKHRLDFVVANPGSWLPCNEVDYNTYIVCEDTDIVLRELDNNVGAVISLTGRYQYEVTL